MKLKSNINVTIFLLLLNLTNNVYFAQIDNSKVGEHYFANDSISSNQDVHLLLFKDNSYLNYGIYVNNSESESYVWYSNGTFVKDGDKLILQSVSSTNKREQLIKDIKYSYKKRKDYVLISSEYEFANTKYENYILKTENNHVFDQKKNLDYYKLE